MAAAAAAVRERWSLAGATALVTGGSKGIGHAIVEELAALGARVHTCSRNAAELVECRRRWAEKGLPVTVSVCDVAVRAEREALMDTVKDVFAGELDILVNNAAQVIVKPATECTAEDFSRIMATNLESCFHLSQLAHPMLRRSAVAGGGSIVHISSIGSCIGAPNMSLYATTKGGMNQLTRSLAAEWARDKIRVNCVAPGTVVTDMARQVPFILEKEDLSWEIASERGAMGDCVGGVVSVYAGSLLCDRPSHLRRRRPQHNKCLIGLIIKQPITNLPAGRGNSGETWL